MPRDDLIQAEGTVIEVLANHRVRLRLANGHCLWARLSSRAHTSLAGLAPGDKARVAMSPCDLSIGWISERINESKA